MTSALSYAGAPSPPHRAHHPLAGFAPTTLRSNRVFESNDVEYTRDQISIILQPHLLSPKGRWQGTQCYVDHFPIGRVGLGTIHFGNMQVHVPSYAHYLVALCLRGNATIRADRKEYSIGGGSAHIMIPGEEMLGTFSADCEQFFVRISTEAVRAHTGFRHLVFRKELDLSSPAVMPWLQQVALIAANPRMAQMISNHPLLSSDYERLLLNLLLAGQSHCERNDAPGQIAPASVRRAEAYIHAHAADPISLSDIAVAAGVPARTLLDSFKHFRQTSPIRYLKDVRLDNARERLRQRGADTVAQVALDAGFAHLGRFAADYSKRFGELPSDTQRRR